MKRLIPRRREFTVLAVLAIVCAAVLSAAARPDAALMLLTMPLALVASLMGARRSGHLRAQ